MRPTTVQLVVLVLVVLLLFGARRLPDLARSVGQSLKIFKSEVKDLQDDSPRAVEGRREDASELPPATAGGAAPATPATPATSEQHRAVDGDRGSTA
ncbi:preprotein translocase subunit TatA [Actinotalea ferrariae CF5-4]|uniref:Sec-independent protein translocase protein TatA n=1 Tax=Actinotalea ferrariae CF5-4 TaxID=948458 RepID=A0A021VQ48_9CELL|nr:Sec-independent protein translocase subunit TatA [Actinotalea ferrariae]EYR63238.1 preprotein translocase subunit TatA [Actinotalea ferrariae CF5-4]